MKKSVVVLRLAGLSIPKKIERSRFIVTSMTGNANFTTPNPPLAAITGNANTLETAHLAVPVPAKREVKPKELRRKPSATLLSLAPTLRILRQAQDKIHKERSPPYKNWLKCETFTNTF